MIDSMEKIHDKGSDLFGKDISIYCHCKYYPGTFPLDPNNLQNLMLLIFYGRTPPTATALSTYRSVPQCDQERKTPGPPQIKQQILCIRSPS